MDHFEITLEAFGIKDAFHYPHVRLRNGAIQGYEWDARIPVAGDHLDIYPVPQQSPDAVVTLFITVEDELGQVSSHPGLICRASLSANRPTPCIPWSPSLAAPVLGSFSTITPLSSYKDLMYTTWSVAFYDRFRRMEPLFLAYGKNLSL